MPHPLGGALRNDAVWRLSHTSGLSREQSGLGRLKLAEVAHVTRDSDTTFKVKGQGHRGQGHIVAASCTTCLFQLYRNYLL